MKNALPTPFPHGADVSRDFNPAIRLFGKRFIIDQPIPEYLLEFLVIVNSRKAIGDVNEGVTSPFPTLEQIKNWPKSALLSYEPTVRLNLKLFAFLSSSRIDSRHDIHRAQYEKLWKGLQRRINSTRDDTEDVVEWLEDLLKGFRGAGLNRTWCAQSFFPVAASLLAPETIWNETVVKTKPVASWESSVESFGTYYSLYRYNFLARGGEVLYLQLCNVFAQEQRRTEEFARSFAFTAAERDLEQLHAALQLGFESLYGGHDLAIDNLADFIEGIDPDTIRAIDKQMRKFECGWCPADSWKEGYLFAVEVKRLLHTAIDPVEKLELLMTGCALQVLRSMCAQSVRYLGCGTAGEKYSEDYSSGGGLGYSLIFTPVMNPTRHLQLTSQRNLQAVLGLIQKVLRTGSLIENAKCAPSKRTLPKILKEADDKYGYKLFRALGKKLGIVVPYKGPGARFAMTDDLLRYFVLTLLEPGESCTYDAFLDRLYANHGIAVEGNNLRNAIDWSNLPPNLSTEYDDSSWLREMLRAGGFLTELSDGYSIVTNTFEKVQMRGSRER
ncbi:MAG: hypothetical protein ACOX48_02975 [Limnochordia bacterium]|jgi:hypothetical protein